MIIYLFGYKITVLQITKECKEYHRRKDDRKQTIQVHIDEAQKQRDIEKLDLDNLKLRAQQLRASSKERRLQSC